MAHDWMTAYQVNQLLLGRGEQLTLGPYLVLERLGEGGAGQVFKARDRKLGSLVAIKVIRKELLRDADVVARFSRDSRSLRQLNHPNVVRAPRRRPGRRHVASGDGVRRGDRPRPAVKQGGPLPVQQASSTSGRPLGLAACSEQGLVHRDIKPHNLIMSLRGGLVKVADLGLARLPRRRSCDGVRPHGAGRPHGPAR